MTNCITENLWLENLALCHIETKFRFLLRKQIFQEIHGFSGLEIAQKAQNGDIDALKIFEEYGEILSDLFKTIILVLNPEAIIIGGSIAKSYKFLRNH